MRNIVLASGLLISLLIVLFKLAEIQLIKGNIRMEIIIAITSVIFFAIGVYFNRKKNLTADSDTFEASESPQLFIDKKFQQTEQFGLSKREREVLQKMGEGLSNQQIGQALYLSENTIKTHVSNILFKLDAKRRTEALKIAREKGMI